MSAQVPVRSGWFHQFLGRCNVANSDKPAPALNGGPEPVQRQILPIPDAPYTGFVAYDARDPETKYPPIKPVHPPDGAPNVLVVLIDDVGFGASSAFGGRARRRSGEARGRRAEVQPFSYHGPLLSHAAALLAGRNHHTVGMGAITELATSAPGYNSMRPNTARRSPRCSS